LNSVRLYGALLKAGVELYEYNRTMMHHKIMMVDGLWFTVGTSNFDNRSFSHNEENNVSGIDVPLARSLLESFERDVAVCDPITLDEWRGRPIWHKTAEALASFVQDQV
jgi:cardiolipin synthase